jgi:hypothetical protein
MLFNIFQAHIAHKIKMGAICAHFTRTNHLYPRIFFNPGCFLWEIFTEFNNHGM